MKSKYWAIFILTALTLTVSFIYYIQKPALDVGPITIHHVDKTPATSTPLLQFVGEQQSVNDNESGMETFVYKDMQLTYEVNNKDRNLDIYLIQNGGKQLFIKDVVWNFYNDEQLIFKKTKLPNVVILENGVGDAGLYIFQQFYVNLDTKQYIKLEYDHDQIIRIGDLKGNQYNISLATQGECKEIKHYNGYLLEGSVKLIGLNLNNIFAYNFMTPVEQKCGIPDFEPFTDLKTDGLSENMEYIIFSLNLINSDGKEVGNEKFMFDLNTIQIRKYAETTLFN